MGAALDLRMLEATASDVLRSTFLPRPVDIDVLAAWLSSEANTAAIDQLERDHAAFRAEIDATQRRWSCDEDMSK